ncbi:hypothetical protein ARMSODRAFT_978665 [Armillaria solidipes]|uniref:Extracellular metalloproteinase n=1 Tax=Armillaria solidipes TaxID=1076256 RepID=A0A2H3BG09_9AGAR|nr:hypothetical protein ARMSODRAFT_978665 [Armillaria solidipes]
MTPPSVPQVDPTLTIHAQMCSTSSTKSTTMPTSTARQKHRIISSPTSFARDEWPTRGDHAAFRKTNKMPPDMYAQYKFQRPLNVTERSGIPSLYKNGSELWDAYSQKKPMECAKVVRLYVILFQYSSIHHVHDIGEACTNMLRDVSVALVEAHGFPSTLYLFIDALSLQSCKPTLPNTRDTWIEADQTQYDGSHACTLWNAFPVVV